MPNFLKALAASAQRARVYVRPLAASAGTAVLLGRYLAEARHRNIAAAATRARMATSRWMLKAALVLLAGVALAQHAAADEGPSDEGCPIGCKADEGRCCLQPPCGRRDSCENICDTVYTLSASTSFLFLLFAVGAARARHLGDEAWVCWFEAQVNKAKFFLRFAQNGFVT